MDLSKMTPEEARAIVTQAQNVFDASIADQQRTSPKEIQSFPIDLTIGKSRSNAVKISFPFKSLLVEQATDINTYVYVIPISNDSGNDPIRMGLKDVFKSEFGFRECYIYWDAQASKSILLKFFVRSIIENGRLVLDQGSGTNEISMGGATAQNDGFTVLAKATFPPINAGPSTMGATLIGINDISYQTGNLIISGANTKFFQVPKGYTAEVLSTELLVTTSIVSNDWYVFLSGLPNNSSYSLLGNIGQTGKGRALISDTIGAGGVLTASNQRYFKNIEVASIYAGGLTVAQRDPNLYPRRVFFSEECIGAIFQNRAGASAGGEFKAYFLIRFTKNVE